MLTKWGRHDAYSQPRSAQRMKDRAPNGRQSIYRLPFTYLKSKRRPDFYRGTEVDRACDEGADGEEAGAGAGGGFQTPVARP